MGDDIETRDFGSPDRPYEVVADRLVVIDDREYVHCPLHGLIPLDHECSKAPGDHWCRSAAHPRIDVALGVDGLEQRMEAMGMVAIEVTADDGESADVWIERGDETDGGY